LLIILFYILGVIESVTLNAKEYKTLLRDLLLVKQYRLEVWREKEEKKEWLLVNSVSIF
jgi:hypothetical protein